MSELKLKKAASGWISMILMFTRTFRNTPPRRACRLFLSDVLSLQARMDADGAEQAVESHRSSCCRQKPCCPSSREGWGALCERVCVMLQFLPVPTSSPTDWVARATILKETP